MKADVTSTEERVVAVKRVLKVVEKENAFVQSI